MTCIITPILKYLERIIPKCGLIFINQMHVVYGLKPREKNIKNFNSIKGIVALNPEYLQRLHFIFC